MQPPRDRDPRPGRRPRFSLLAGVWIAAWAELVCGRAHAVPLDDPDIGGIGFSGPTTGDLAAVYWNPAALGLIHGLQVMVAGKARLSTTTVSRASIDPTTGNPGAGVSFPDVKAADRSQPITWPLGPGSFVGIGYDVGGDRFALAAAMYMPFADRSAYETTPGEALATRYHRISADLRNLALVPALAVRFAGDFRLGLAPGFLFSTGRLSFAQATACAVPPCPAEDPASDAVLNLGSGMGILSAKFAVTLGAGIYFRRRAWAFGFSYSSRPFGDVDGASLIAADRSQVSRAVGSAGQTSFPIYADVVYKLPYTMTGGVAWHPVPGTEVSAIARLLSFPAGDVIDIRLTSAGLSQAGIPAHIVLHRGYDTVLDTRVRVSRWLNERLRIGAGLRFETSGLPSNAVSPAAVDGYKVEPTAMVLFQPVRSLSIQAGYGFTYMLPVTASPSIYQPTADADCTTAGGDLRNPNCMARLDGTARPTAAGRYRHFEHDFSLSLATQF